MTEMLGLCRPAAADADYERWLEIAARLKQSAPIDVEVISTEDGGREFELLARDVHAAIAGREPEVGLDRLHTRSSSFAAWPAAEGSWRTGTSLCACSCGSSWTAEMVRAEEPDPADEDFWTVAAGR